TSSSVASGFRTRNTGFVVMCVRRLQRHVAVLALRELFALRPQHVERPHEHASGLAWIDDVVDVAALGGAVRVREPFGVLSDQLRTSALGIFGGLDVLA